MPRKFSLTRKKYWRGKKFARGQASVAVSANLPSPRSELCTTAVSFSSAALPSATTVAESSADSPHSSQALSPPLLLEQLDVSLCSLPPGWYKQTIKHELRICKLASIACTSLSQPTFVSHCIAIKPDLSWEVFVSGHRIKPDNPILLAMPSLFIDHGTVMQLVSALDLAHVCHGYPNKDYIDMANQRKGIFQGKDGAVRAHIDTSHPVVMNNIVFPSTVRVANCQIISSSTICKACKDYSSVLRAIHSRWQKSTQSHEVSKFTNNRFLTSPQKRSKLKQLQDKVLQKEKERKNLQERISALTSESGVEVDATLHQDLTSIMQENSPQIEAHFPQGTFRRLFWEQQLKAALKGPKQMRWHPSMIRWCLCLKLLSSSAYHCLRTSGFVKLPSERTLRDYTHLFKSKTGFQVIPKSRKKKLLNYSKAEVDRMLRQEVENEEWKNYVVLLVDELKVKESLVFDKHECEVIGFVELEDIDYHLGQLEKQLDSGHPHVATHLLTFMVRGLLTSIKFPYAHFPTDSLSGDQLFPIVWEAIERLERIGFKVIAVTADGASPNRKFFHMHSSGKSSQLCYKSLNPYTSEDRCVYFICDVPHLMKTTRNCWSHSSKNGTRYLTVNGKNILWGQLRWLYDAKVSLSNRSNGLFMLKKLTKEHLDLTSFSRMRVDLAAQVLSSTVAKAFAYYGSEKTTETERFIEKFDTFFDCLNVRHPEEYIRRIKPNLKPYSSVDDERFTWLEDTFLGYLDDWENSVNSLKGVPEAEKAKMLLSRETIEGLHITVKSFVELSKYLLAQPFMKGKYILSEHLSQDPVENYFGKLRYHGGWCQNPTISACINAAQSIRVQGSMAMMPVRGNSSRKRRIVKGDVIDDTPLQKRRRRNN